MTSIRKTMTSIERKYDVNGKRTLTQRQWFRWNRKQWKRTLLSMGNVNDFLEKCKDVSERQSNDSKKNAKNNGVHGKLTPFGKNNKKNINMETNNEGFWTSCFFSLMSLFFFFFCQLTVHLVVASVDFIRSSVDVVFLF